LERSTLYQVQVEITHYEFHFVACARVPSS